MHEYGIWSVVPPVFAIVLAIVSGAVAYLLDGVFVGAVLAAFRLRSRRSVSRLWLFAGLLIVFAALDLYWLPAVLALDLTLKIGNPNVAALLGSEFPAAGLVSLGWFDFLVWAAQGLVAIWVADRLS